MPREAPVTRAIREARGWVVIEANSGATYTVSYAGLTRVSIHFARDFHETMDCRVKPGNDELLARFRQQRQLPRLRFDLGLVGEVGRVDAGEAVVREFRIGGVAAGLAHGAIHAVDRQERERVRADDIAHFLERMRRGQEAAAVGQVDAVII